MLIKSVSGYKRGGLCCSNDGGDGMSKDFSVIIPVRNNISGLVTCLGAFDLFTADKRRLEVLLLVDDDDNDISTYNRLHKRHGFDIRILTVKPTDNFSDGYYNHAVRSADGGNIWAFNDDCYVHTTKWDDRIRRSVDLADCFKGVYLVSTMDSTFYDTPTHPFPRFPMISRKAVDTIGFFFFPQIRQYPADKAIYELYDRVGCVIKCHDVKLQHDHVYQDNPSGQRFMRILQEDKANGVFPVDSTVQHKALYKAITGKDLC